MAPTRTRLAGLIPVTFQKINLSNSTAVAVNTTVRTARILDITVETQNARYRADGTAPTLTTGVVLMKNERVWRWEGYNGTSALMFQRVTGNAIVSIMAWKHPGDQA